MGLDSEPNVTHCILTAEKKYITVLLFIFVKFKILLKNPSKLMDSPSPCSSRRGSYTPVTSSSAASTSLGNTKVSDLKLILVNAVVAGLEIASSVAFTFIPPLLLKSGYSETQMTIIFGVGKN